MTLISIDETFGDWDGPLDLILASFAYMHPRIDPPSSALRLTVQSLREKATVEKAYAAEEDGRLLGCVFCTPEPPDVLYIGKLAVAPDAQGRGIGRLLMKAAADIASASGLSVLRLETRIELEENHRIFSRWGFVKAAEAAHPGYDRPTYIEMRKTL